MSKNKIILSVAAFGALAFGVGLYTFYFNASPLDELRRNAKSGDASAQLEFGLDLLRSGNRDEGLEYISKAADQDSVEAYTTLGRLYFEGKFVEKNLKSAEKWFREAASKGHVPALLSLGIMFRDGTGVEKSLPEAESFFRIAASSGDPNALFVLAELYSRPNFPGDQAKLESKKIFENLASAGNMKAMLALAVQSTTNGDQKSSCDWYEKAAEKGNSTAAIGLALCFQDGEGREQNDVAFHKWLTKAADAGNAKAYLVLGEAYTKGNGVAKSESEADIWFKKAAQAGEPRAKFNLAMTTLKGEANDAEKKDAKVMLREAAELGYAPAQFEYAILIGKGDAEGGANDSLASYWYQQAANNQYLPAMYNLAVLYAKGSGVSLDLDKARSLLEQASKQGHERSEKFLNKLSDKSYIEKVSPHAHQGHDHGHDHVH